MKMLKLTSMLAIPLICAGCILTTNPYRGSNTFDLGHPAKAEPQTVVAVGLFNNDSPARLHMLYRENGTQLVSDEYNNWAQTPDLMIQRYLAAAFPIASGSDKEKMIQLTGSVEAFEIDIAESKAILHLEYTLSQDDRNDSGTLTIAEACDARTPEAFAKAMTRAAERAARELAAAAQKFQEK